MARMVQWNLEVPSALDANLRDHLKRSGKVGPEALTAFVIEAVDSALLRNAFDEVRAGFSDLSANEVEALVDEALTALRAERRIAA